MTRGPHAPWLTGVSLSCPVVAALLDYWTILDATSETGPPGESGLIALGLMLFMTTSLLLGGVATGLLARLRSEPRRLATLALAINAILLVGGWLTIFAFVASR
ncbi:MAG TPA: hypothetical protein VMN78_00680 [Longimicrobiales bacterium]|nr:hypothetical protein [Longimicrobiales bacterium]